MAEAPKFNLRNPAVKRIMQEIKEIKQDTSGDFLAEALETDIFEWHFVIRGPQDTEFDGGIYHGRILLPAEYPFKPPSFMMLTPNGRFETNVKICLSISSHHPEHWQPSWSVRTALMALIAFMPSPGAGALGALDFSKDERRVMAARSRLDAPRFGSAERQRVIDEMHGRLLSVAAAKDAERQAAAEGRGCNEAAATASSRGSLEAPGGTEARAPAGEQQQAQGSAQGGGSAGPQAGGDAASKAERGGSGAAAFVTAAAECGTGPAGPVGGDPTPSAPSEAAAASKQEPQPPSLQGRPHSGPSASPSTAAPSHCTTAPPAPPAAVAMAPLRWEAAAAAPPLRGPNAAAALMGGAVAAGAGGGGTTSADHMLTALMWALYVGIGAILLKKVMGVMGMDLTELMQ